MNKELMKQKVEFINRMTEAELVAFLDAGCFAGYRSSSGNCPIARFLRTGTETPADNIFVSFGKVFLRANQKEKARETFVLSDTVRTFTNDFDNGEYPDLANYSGRLSTGLI